MDLSRHLLCTAARRGLTWWVLLCGQDWRQRYPGGVPNRTPPNLAEPLCSVCVRTASAVVRSGPDTAPAATVEACIAICKELFHPAPDRKTSCGAAAWNGPSKQCYLKTHKAKPVRAPALTLPY